MWTPEQEKLLRALDAEVLLDGVREGLQLWQTEPSDRADLHLLKALQGENVLHSALERVTDDGGRSLRRAVDAAWPAELTPVVVHHLALSWLRSSDASLQKQGRLGMLYLAAHRRSWLIDLVASAAGSEAAEDAVHEMPVRLVRPLLDVIRDVGTSRESVPDVSAAWAELLWLEERVSDGPLSAGVISDRLRTVRQKVRQSVIDGVQERCAERLADADKARIASDLVPYARVFQPALHVVNLLGHTEELTTWVCDVAAEAAWPLSQDGKHAALRAFLQPIEPFLDDLQHRLEAGEAFGRQSIFADHMVFLAAALRSANLPLREQLEERHALLERGLEIAPNHRNSRVVLAGVKLSLADLELLESSRGSHNALKRARVLVDEAAELRPEHSDLKRIRAKLEAAGG